MSRLLLALPDSWQRRYRRWLDRRIPPRKSVQLHQGNLFIFLSRQGLHYLLLVLLVWVGATNFQNNLAYGLSFFLLAVVIVAILQTFANASGLQLRFIDVEPVCAGEVAQVRIELLSASARQQLVFGWPAQDTVQVSVLPQVPRAMLLPHRTIRRGVMRPGRLRLQTVFPLGIVRCWSWLDLDVEWLVYPQPVAADYRDCCSGSGDEEGGALIAGTDEYFALKPYVEGEPRSRIAWKQFAAGRGLQVREYAARQGSDVILDLSVLQDADLELRLSRLCYCARQLHEQGRPFGLCLPGQPPIPVGSGEAHVRSVLTALALYGS